MAVDAQSWLDAQYSVLGAMLIEEAVVPRVLQQTTEGDFSGVCLTVYRCIRDLFNGDSPVDPVAVAGRLGREYQDFLVQLMQITPTAANIDSYIRLCREQARVNQVRELAQQMLAAQTCGELRALLEQAGARMVDKPALGIVTMEQALRSFHTRHTQQAHYLPWPIRELEDRLYAELGDFIVVGGLPSTGKSAWALQCAWHWARTYKVGFFSLETSPEKLFDRLTAHAAGVSMDQIKRQISADGWDRLGERTVDITSRHLELIPAAGMTAADVRAVTVMRRYQIILVDYLQLLQGGGENRTAQVTAISIALHTLAQSLGITVVALSQLSRQSKDGKSAPDMSALRESGQIEQDADIVLLLSLADKGNPAGDRVLHIAKNKEGTCPKIRLAFDGKLQTFSKSGAGVQTKLIAEGKKARRQTQVVEQLPILPEDTPVLFDETP